jgi:hypothetical protein
MTAAFPMQDPEGEPIKELPDGWSGGQVQGLGGGMVGRVFDSEMFRREEGGRPARYTVIYNDQDQNVSLDLEERRDGHSDGAYTHAGHITQAGTGSTDHATDELLFDIAVALMQYANRAHPLP